MKSFVERKINVQMALDGDTFDGSSNTIDLSGLRVQATILNISGTSGSCTSQLQMRVSGMKNADMAKLSTLGLQYGTFARNSIKVSAGDDQSGMALVFQGGIVYGNVDYNAMPDVGLEIVASTFAEAQYSKAAAPSFKGAEPVADMIQSIAQAAGFGFHNNGVTAVLNDHWTSGTAIDQIMDICAAARIHWFPQDGTIYIWPASGTRNDIVTEVGPNTGMVGYPCYRIGGINVTSLFNPAVGTGQRVRVTSSTPAPSKAQATNGQIIVPGANGTFYCGIVTHDIASQTPGGPWFTHMELWDNNVTARPS